MSSLDNTSYELAKRGYANYDSSHGISHAIAVVKNAWLIYIGENIYRISPFIIVQDTALFHDVHDHKYKEHEWGISKKELYSFLEKRHGEYYAKAIQYTIDNMSWSKRDSLGTRDEHSKYFVPWIFHCTRDADFIESLDVGRCIDYSKRIKRAVPEGVIQHIYEKIIKIMDTLHYSTSKELARPKHNEMLRWLEEAQSTVSLKRMVLALKNSEHSVDDKEIDGMIDDIKEICYQSYGRDIPFCLDPPDNCLLDKTIVIT
jgi:HD superfamily phosphodiesterase